MWRLLYVGVCWLVGSNENDRQPEREQIMDEATNDDQGIRTIEATTVERCGRCGGKAVTLWELDADEWWFCDTHNRIHGRKLHGLGFISHRLIGA